MKFNTRKWVKPEDLNANQTLFGGKLLAWIDEEAALYSIIQLENKKVVTKYISEINFMSTAHQGDIVEIGTEVIKFGKSSIVRFGLVRFSLIHANQGTPTKRNPSMPSRGNS